ncbi:MAG: hypothetical protein Q4D45_01530 [Lachnospiraceae bacterium]|nr:hypothetical protein [Lachnospiraceae bacterium]
MSKIMYTEVLRTTNITEYNKKEQEFIELDDKTKSMLTTYIRKVTFHSQTAEFPADYSIVMEDMEDVFIEKKEKEINVVTKELIPITKEQANAILDGDYEFLKESSDKNLRDFYDCIINQQLVPAYRKEFTRKTFHQNKFLDIIFDLAMSRKPYKTNDFFAPKGFTFNTNYTNLRMSIRHNLSVSKPMEQLLAFEKELSANSEL